ncbi:MAG TPA: flavoprotein [Candidatus Paceibacterota bacterium]|nr:phosphopantothenoylcysteine decarboxylase [Verrucomicrobiota bacterium]HOX01593.1 flavoprotein [Verrucomicrobiota bacterium]HRZ44331.1 flavoprotein [Candidatus Paceibacterota bacterium]HRZ93392.1 flavoprotein [Candidatus Paceibacterota bacterium]
MSQPPCIILGVTGSIAAHKAIDIASLLTRNGCAVHVILTPDAQRFLSPVPFKTLSRHPVVTDLYGDAQCCQPAHIRLADEADLMLVAPATAQTIAKLALGLADNALCCTALALNPAAKLLIAPAMHSRMWLHPATQAHVATLRARGAEFIGPEEGVLACGSQGVGRLWPADKIAAHALQCVEQRRDPGQT